MVDSLYELQWCIMSIPMITISLIKHIVLAITIWNKDLECKFGREFALPSKKESTQMNCFIKQLM